MFNNCTFLLKSTAIFLISMAFCSVAFAQSNVVYLNSSTDHHWKVKPQADITEADHINTIDYNTKNWVDAVVPGTTFSSYVAAGLEKDPNFGDNIYKVDKAKYDHSFWYRTEFKVPAGYSKNHILLNFK